MDDTDEFKQTIQIFDSKEVNARAELQRDSVVVYFKLEPSIALALAKLDIRQYDSGTWEILTIYVTERNSRAEMTRLLHSLSSRPAPELCARVLLELSFDADLLAKKGFENVDLILFELLRKHRAPLNNLQVRYTKGMKPPAMLMLGIWILERVSPSRLLFSYEHSTLLRKDEFNPPMNTLMKGFLLHGVNNFGDIEIKPRPSGISLLIWLGYSNIWLKEKMQWFKKLTSP